MPSLFVDEDEMQVDGVEEHNEEVDGVNELTNGVNPTTNGGADEIFDPIVKSIPLVMGQVPNPATQSLHLLQYPGRPKDAVYSSVKASVKPQAGCLELKVPLDTTKFYDESRTDEWATRVVEHRLQGVLDKLENESGPTGNYLAQLVEDGSKIVLVPLDRSVQLRPAFTYLDDLEAARQVQRKTEIAAENATAGVSQNAVQVLQTSMAKQQGQGPQGDNIASHALGESLKTIKKYQDESWEELKFRDVGDEKVEEIRKQLKEAPERVLQSKMLPDDYIMLLIT